jgi:hypothetical protein
MGCVDLRADDAAAPVLPEGKELTEEERTAHLGLSLCESCDHSLHLSRARRGHKRMAIKHRTEEALKVEYLGGCSRIKLAWLQVRPR